MDILEYRINHTFREEIIVPFASVSNNISFCLSQGNKQVIMGDGTRGEVVSYDELHICNLEGDVKRLYGISAWDFIKKWYALYPNMDSMRFLKIKLKKNEV